MKLVRTIIFLIAAVILIPVAAFFTDINLNESQLTLIRELAIIMVAVALLCFVVSELAVNYSQVDKLWSIMPIVYSLYAAIEGGFQTRLALMTFLVLVWGVRLSYNFGRRGGYSLKFWQGEEDYRWSVLREMPFLRGRFRWALFNLFFISGYQQTLILLFTLPIVVASQPDAAPLNWIDYLAATLMLGFIIIETIADEQQYRFQEEKHRLKKSGGQMTEEQSRGFATGGLWGIVRHPNYAAEQAIWLSFYLFSVAASGQWLNWSVSGSILLLLLFYGSSTFSENISASKYPGYGEYIKRVPRFIPGLTSRRRFS